jgi:hypothetical protein
MNNTTQRLKALKQAWQSIPNVPDDLTMLGLPGKNGRFIEETIDELACMAAELEFTPAESLVMIKYSCEAYLKSLEAFFNQEISGHPSMQMLTFATHLLQLRSTLKEAVNDASVKTASYRQNPSQVA